MKEKEEKEKMICCSPSVAHCSVRANSHDPVAFSKEKT